MKPSTGYMEVEDGQALVYGGDEDEDTSIETERQFQEMMNNVGAKKFFNEYVHNIDFFELRERMRENERE